MRKEDHLMQLAKTFDILRQYRMKLNPKKCNFGVKSGKFMGHMASQHGIEVNTVKIKVVLDMSAPQSIKKVQRLTERLAALNIFISRMGDKCKPFFDANKKGKFKWTTQSQLTFEGIKEYLSSTQILSKPILGEKLYLYLAASGLALSVILVRS